MTHIQYLVTSLLTLFCLGAMADAMLEPTPLTPSPLSSAPEAAGLPDAYTARVATSTRTQDARAAAFQTGLRQVYMQLTGHADIDRYPPLKESMARATEWVDQYQYQQSG